jgi:hypothetical protein
MELLVSLTPLFGLVGWTTIFYNLMFLPQCAFGAFFGWDKYIYKLCGNTIYNIIRLSRRMPPSFDNSTQYLDSNTYNLQLVY